MPHHSVVTCTRYELSLLMAEEPGLRHIKDLALSEQVARSEERVDEIAMGCLQWLAAAFTLPRGAELLMFEGRVESFLRLVILDTEFFKHLYRRYADYPIRYKPLTISRENIGPFRGYIDWTIEYLHGTFGDALHPELAKWEHAHHIKLLPTGIASR